MTWPLHRVYIRIHSARPLATERKRTPTMGANHFGTWACRNKLHVASNALLARARVAKWEPQRAARIARRLDEVRHVCYLGNVGDTLPHPVFQGKGIEPLGRGK